MRKKKTVHERKSAMEKMKYYRFEKGNVLVRKCGDKVERKGADGVWRSAPELLWRFMSGDMSLVEVDEGTEKDADDQ